ncbi:hypothetical protein [Deinococcus arcticus]|uniref:Uncharacterized protein n=1 Tax=Deinococcus arcticus TaxID=2136176 RepID=A0A2T3W7K7_9DEIO|nr:hypothetical protein [Deinococcus arcticus]PTA67896.1 hypothetical protein C8263_10905 [Deinococcus arcticus]
MAATFPLEAAQQALKAALGDVLARGRPDGVFALAPGGPGSVPALADLDAPELHLDLLPETPTLAQVQQLRALGYVPAQAPGEWTHPGGWRLVLCDHGSGWRAQQAALRTLLLADAAAAQTYRAVFTHSGRQAADEALAPAALAHHARTVGFTPAAQVAELFWPLDGFWMFVAGTALDLHLGRVARPHDDLDVALERAAQAQLPQLLRGWRLDVPVDGAYQPYTGPLNAPLHQVHARHPALPGVQLLDVLLSDLSGGLWRYRREPRLTLPLVRARRFSPDGLPYLAPEAVLLFKAGAADRHPRGKDQGDFERVAPTLDRAGRAWLRGALKETQPGHRWLGELD